MKSFLTILSLLICSIAFGQSPKYDSSLHKKITLSIYEGAKVESSQNMEKEVQKLREDYNKFLQELLIANGITLNRVSTNGDSTKINPHEISMILRPIKSKK